jgi:hypothetical protein
LIRGGGRVNVPRDACRLRASLRASSRSYVPCLETCPHLLTMPGRGEAPMDVPASRRIGGSRLGVTTLGRIPFGDGGGGSRSHTSSSRTES